MVVLKDGLVKLVIYLSQPVKSCTLITACFHALVTGLHIFYGLNSYFQFLLSIFRCILKDVSVQIA